MRGSKFLCAVALVAAICFAFAAPAVACPGAQNVVAGQCAANYVAPQNFVAQNYVAPQAVFLNQVVPQYVYSQPVVAQQVVFGHQRQNVVIRQQRAQRVVVRPQRVQRAQAVVIQSY